MQNDCKKKIFVPLQQIKEKYYGTGIKYRRISFEIKAPEEPVFTKGLKAFYALREKARRNGLQGVSLDDINDEISSARDEH